MEGGREEVLEAVEPFREHFTLLPEGVQPLMYLILIPFVVILLYGIYWKARGYGGKAFISGVFSAIRGGLNYLIGYALLQRKVLKKRDTGLTHLAIYAGALTLLAGTIIVFVDMDILHNLGLGSILRGGFYLGFELILDILGLIFVGGVAVALVRRIFARPERMGNKPSYVAILLTLLYIGLTGFLLEAIRINAEPKPWNIFSPIGAALSTIIPSGASQVYEMIWWSHALAAFTLISLIPYTNLLHILTSPLNILTTNLRHISPAKPKTPFNLMELEEEEEFEVTVGAKSPKELEWAERLEADACTDCGRCQEVCPAYASGTPLSPRVLVQKIKLGIEVGASFLDGLIGDDEAWACTTCGACVEACPVLISPAAMILELRRALVAEGKLDKKKMKLLSNLARAGNAYGLPTYEREEFLKELEEIGVKSVEEVDEYDYLYWLGCAGSYDPRFREVVKTVARILTSTGIRLAYLPEERCTGDPARRLGEEGRFQELAFTNVELLESHGVGRILVSCPHCYNTFRNEYPELGLKVDEVIHHVQLFSRLVKEGKIRPRRKVKTPVTLHDSCYLSRLNRVTDAPRIVLDSCTEKRVEMERSGVNGFCCGGGGAAFWYEVPRKTRESLIRLDEAAGTGAEVLATECPFCLQMFLDAARVKEAEMEVKDVAEILWESVKD